MRSGELSGGVLPAEMPGKILDTICRPDIYGQGSILALITPEKLLFQL